MPKTDDVVAKIVFAALVVVAAKIATAISQRAR